MAYVFWLTGLSGAGKTTIGTLFYREWKEKHPNTVFLDGDTLREVFGQDLGFTREDRLKSAMRNARLCALLGEQDVHVVCCTISMFHSVRDWNREHIPGYREIYIRASWETLARRNQKGLYEAGETPLVGRDIVPEEPQNPDLVLENDGTLSPADQVKRMIKEFTI